MCLDAVGADPFCTMIKRGVTSYKGGLGKSQFFFTLLPLLEKRPGHGFTVCAVGTRPSFSNKASHIGRSLRQLSRELVTWRIWWWCHDREKFGGGWWERLASPKMCRNEPGGPPKKWPQTAQNGSKRLETARKGSKRLETARNGSKRLKTARSGSKRLKTARNGSKRLETARNGSPRNGSKQLKTARNGSPNWQSGA